MNDTLTMTLFTAIGNVELMKDILRDKPDCINEVDEENQTALMKCAARGYNDCIKLILNENGDVHQVNAKGSNALMFAAKFGHSETVKLLLNHGADITHMNKLEFSVLMVCANGNSPAHNECMRVLIESFDNDLPCQQCDKRGRTPLMICASLGNVEGVRMLLQECPSLINSRYTFFFFFLLYNIQKIQYQNIK